MDYKDRVTGAKRYFDANVNINSDGTAGLVYCSSSRLRVNENGFGSRRH